MEVVVNKSKMILITTLAVTVLCVAGYIVFVHEGFSLSPLDIVLFGLIILVGAFAIIKASKKNKEEKEGYPVDDEFSKQIKYKAGYYAFQTSMYIWLFIFLFRSKLPDFETAIGGGIILSAASSFVIEYFIKRKLHEK